MTPKRCPARKTIFSRECLIYPETECQYDNLDLCKFYRSHLKFRAEFGVRVEEREEGRADNLYLGYDASSKRTWSKK